ncbi:MAG: BON domain-containing protein, partial [Gammaproteobacteria bacterium]|nr:BON domain-containing protein [Gammaproteobacteria bacterium]
KHRIKRTPVLHQGKLAGIVSRANLLHGLASQIVDQHEPHAAADRQLRDKLLEKLLDTQGLNSVLVNVTVNEGRVKLWGVVENAEEKRAAQSALESESGVKSIENNLALEPMSGVPV